MLAKEIGFQADALNGYNRYRDIYAFSPNHPCLEDAYHYGMLEIPSILCQVFEDRRTGKSTCFIT